MRRSVAWLAAGWLLLVLVGAPARAEPPEAVVRGGGPPPNALGSSITILDGGRRLMTVRTGQSDVWDLQTGEVVTLPGALQHIQSIGARRWATLEQRDALVVLDLDTGQEHVRIERPRVFVLDVAPGGRWIAVGARDERDTDVVLIRPDGTPGPTLPGLYQQSQFGPFARFSPDGTALLVDHGIGPPRRWDLERSPPTYTPGERVRGSHAVWWPEGANQIPARVLEGQRLPRVPPLPRGRGPQGER